MHFAISFRSNYSTRRPHLRSRSPASQEDDPTDLQLQQQHPYRYWRRAGSQSDNNANNVHRSPTREYLSLVALMQQEGPFTRSELESLVYRRLSRRHHSQQHGRSHVDDAESRHRVINNLIPESQYSLDDLCDLLYMIQGNNNATNNSNSSPFLPFENTEQQHHQPHVCLPATDEAIQSLIHARVMPWDKASDDPRKCGICWERLVDGVAVSRLPCGHTYHINCIFHWFTQTNTCPECRYELRTNDPDYEMGRQERMKNRKTYTCSCNPNGYHTCFFPPQPLQVEMMNDETCICPTTIVDDTGVDAPSVEPCNV